VQKILSHELDRIENEAWEFYGVERTPDAVEEIRAWIEYEFGTCANRLSLDAMNPEERPVSAAQLIFLSISMCRKEIDRWLIPEIAVTLLVFAGKMLAMSEKDKNMPTVADIMSIVGKRAAHSRHAENRKKADEIKALWREDGHNYKSMNAAAEALYGRMGVSYQTAYKHIAAEAKKLRSARRE
jgi:hypothetical protein